MYINGTKMHVFYKVFGFYKKNTIHDVVWFSFILILMIIFQPVIYLRKLYTTMLIKEYIAIDIFSHLIFYRFFGMSCDPLLEIYDTN